MAVKQIVTFVVEIETDSLAGLYTRVGSITSNIEGHGQVRSIDVSDSEKTEYNPNAFYPKHKPGCRCITRQTLDDVVIDTPVPEKIKPARKWGAFDSQEDYDNSFK